jgi:hypothetical protein
MYRISFFIFTAVMLLVLAGCPPSTVTLKPRALEFVHKAYDAAAITTYMTPVLQESIKNVTQNAGATSMAGDGGGASTGSAMPGPAPMLARLGQEPLSKVTDADLKVESQGKWAQVTVSVTMPYGREDIKTTWLFLNGTWYLYAGSGGEETTYGKAPYFVD